MSRIALCATLFACMFLHVPLSAGEGETEIQRLRDEMARIRAQVKEGQRAAVDKGQTAEQAIRDQLKMRLADLNAKLEDMKLRYKPDGPEIASIEKVREDLMRRLDDAELAIVVKGGDEFAKPAAEKKPAQNGNAQNNNVSRLRVKLPTGAELEAEGPWLQSMPDVTREILDQFTDTVKDGAISMRIPDGFDPESIVQLHKTLANIAPKVTVEFLDHPRFLIASSEDLVQLRRVSAVLRGLQKNPNPNPNNFPNGFFDPNQKKFNTGGGFAPRVKEPPMGEEQIKLPDGRIVTRRFLLEENGKTPMKEPKPKDQNNDQF